MSANTFTCTSFASLSRLRRTGTAEIDREVLDEVDERVVDLERAAADHDRPADADGLDAGVAVAELLVEPPRAVVVDARADADPAMAAGLCRTLRCERDGRPEAVPPPVLADEDVLDLRHAECRVGPGDVRMRDRVAGVPGDEIRAPSAESRKRQRIADRRDVAVGQLADVDEATSRRRNVDAPPLSSISLRLPHLGL